jgi:hypothetical protein
MAPFWSEYAPDLHCFYLDTHWTGLSHLTGVMLGWLLDQFGISRDCLYQTSLGVEAQGGTELVIALCRAVGADTFLFGPLVQDFKHPTYPQLHGDFVPNLSALDALFNVGPAACELI